MIKKDGQTFRVDNWKRGDSITASRLQQPVDAIRKLTTGIKPPRQVTPGGGAVSGNFWGIVTACDRDSGFALVRKAKGTITELEVVDEESEEIVVFIGIESHIVVGDEVECRPTGSGITPDYAAYAPLVGFAWQPLQPYDMCPVQDLPELREDCDDEVEP